MVDCIPPIVCTNQHFQLERLIGDKGLYANVTKQSGKPDASWIYKGWVPFLILSLYIAVDTLDVSTMLDRTELRSRHEAIRITEGSKDKIIEVCFVHNVGGLDFTDGSS